MRKKAFKYIYGPVSSWRLGASLGIDLLSRDRKICTFDCTYCQIGRTTEFTTRPRAYVKTSQVIAELKRLPRVRIDYITFSGRGEPCLAGNLGEVIKAVKELKVAPVAVLTNSSLISQPSVRKHLLPADFVIAKLDAYSQESLRRVNKPADTIRLDKIVKGIKQFRKQFKGRLALQIMFTGQNKDDAGRLAGLARKINPDEVQINTPTRPCGVKSLDRRAINTIKKYFCGLSLISVYDKRPKKVIPLSRGATLKRRGKRI